LKNLLLNGVEGGFTKNFLANGDQATIYDASMAYQAAAIPLVILAGKEYGSGSSRDWAAKGTALLGVRAVIAESFERIHRSNLIGMGVLPLQFQDGESANSLGITGDEVFEITGVEELNTGPAPKLVNVKAGTKSFKAKLRIDTPGEADYYRHGGIMQYVLRSLLK
jgi:aconitate hydratase